MTQTRFVVGDMECPSCGEALADDGNYCGWCGWNDTYGDHGVEPARKQRTRR